MLQGTHFWKNAACSYLPRARENSEQLRGVIRFAVSGCCLEGGLLRDKPGGGEASEGREAGRGRMSQVSRRWHLRVWWLIKLAGGLEGKEDRRTVAQALVSSAW